MKIIIGFFMSWGCFSAIPCPYKKWDEDARDYMLAELPLIGLMHGLVWWGLYWLLIKWLVIPKVIGAVVLGLALPGLAGFIHMDGYMDCCDAIFSRRDLAERQRILKDSTVGAFAAIGLVALLMLQCAAMYEAMQRPEFVPLMIVIPVLSRAMSAEAVWSYAPLSRSQYNKTLNLSQKKERTRAKWLILFLVLTILILFFVIFDRANLLKLVSAFDVILIIELAAHYISCKAARNNLGGMSGDISGFAITISEVAAILAMALL